MREYIVVLIREKRVIWWRLENGEYVEIEPEPEDGVLKSRIFPGLWLDPAALLNGDIKRVFDTLHNGLDSPEHAAFCEQLKKVT